MARLRLTLACGGYDRTRALEEGTVRPDGIELTYLRLPVEETFFRMMRHHEFEVCELSLSSYVISLQEPEPPFIAIPVYPSRQFRHSSIYVNADAGVQRPEDLPGHRVGTPEYQLTACVWVRGTLADHYGVPIDSVTYVTGGQEELGRIEKAPLRLPERLRVEAGRADRTLSQQLADGDVDALFTPRVPSPFAAGDPRVRRLFPDVIAAERDYFARTAIFPIMHVVVIRRDVYQTYPWVAQSLTKAFGTAKAAGEADLYDSSALRVMEPWLIPHLEQARAALGSDFWSYGLAANRNTLATFLRYHHDQGLSSTLLEPEGLFAPESLESFAI